MKIKDKRIAGELLGRDGISQRIITIASEIADGTYKDAISLGGRIAVLVESATYDDYWCGKAEGGKVAENNVLEAVIGGSVSKERAMREVIV